jgi:exodeoxyribonuclease V beta subunit
MSESSLFDPLTQTLSGATSIEASAGTGKTYSITLLWLRLLIERCLRVDQILVSTFTQAATAELRERLLASLRRALSAAQAISEGRPVDDLDEARILSRWWVANPDARAALIEHLTQSLSTFDLAPIQTLHGFCQSLISRHSLELGCDPDLKLQEDCDTLLEQITGDFLMEESDTQALDAAALRRMARTLQARPAAAVRGVSLSRDQLRDAKAALVSRIAQEAPAAIASLTNATSRNAVAKMVKNLIEASQWKALSDPQVKNLPPSFSDLWARYPRLEFSEKQLPATRLAERIRIELPRRKTQAGVRTFDDILLTVHKALDAQGSEGPMARAVRSRLKAAILDECQDSDTLQIEVFQSLFAHADTESFLIIGDPKQSIYRFRGADLASYRSLAQAVHPAPRMTVNHRSDPSLVAAINHLYGPAFRFPDSLVGDAPFEYVPVTARATEDRIWDPAPRKAVVLQWSPESDRSRALPRLARLAAREIVRLLHDPVEITDRHTRQRRRLLPGDIGVLASNHRELRLVRRELQAGGVACQSSGKGLGSVFASDEALDVLAWLELLAALHHHGELLGRLSAFLLSPLGAESAAHVLEIQTHPTLQAEAFQRFLQAQQDLGRVGPLAPLLRWITGSEVSTRNLSCADGERRITNWRQVGVLLQGRFDQGLRSAESLAAWLARQVSEAPESLGDAAGESTLMRLETDASAVQLNTIHGAKGLEYPVVFCPFLGIVRGRSTLAAANAAVARLGDAWVVDVGSDEFEATQEASQVQEAEEDDRRLYVALTRARHRLYLGVAPIAASKRGPKNNSAADSPLALLPGLAPPAMDQWPSNWSALEPHGIHFLADSPTTTATVASESAPAGTPSASAVLLSPPSPRPYLFAPFAVRSFTSLSRSDLDHDLSAADRDLAALDATPSTANEAAENTDVLATLGTAGSLLGDQLHRALEDYLGNGRSLEQAVAGYDQSENWQQALAAILEADLELAPGVRLRLKELRGDCITEMQFHLPVGRVSPAALSAVLIQDPGIQAIPGGPEWAESLAGWSFTEFTGFLQGFIDLIFERGGRWYVADYKSNRLHRYHAATLSRVMLDAHYLLQARLYLLALHRHLRSNLVDYEPDRHLGGVAYLFVRGFPGQGVWLDQPQREALDRLDALFHGPDFSP